MREFLGAYTCSYKVATSKNHYNADVLNHLHAAAPTKYSDILWPTPGELMLLFE